MSKDSPNKIETARRLFSEQVDQAALLAAIDVSASEVRTPLMFEHQLMERARTDRKHIVLPEAGDDRILTAADILLRRGVADLTLLGDENTVRARASALGLDLDAVTVVSPTDPALVERFAAAYAEARAHKGMTLERAREVVTDVSYFGTMMVHLGLADGMVSGAVHTTAHTIRPGARVREDEAGRQHGLERVPHVPGRPGAGLRRLRGDPRADDRAAGRHRRLLGGDRAAVRHRPARRDALLLHRQLRLGRRRGEGAGGHRAGRRSGPPTWPSRDRSSTTPPSTRTSPGPSCRTRAVAGHATVFVFPDLNTGNNTYKAVQRSAHAVAIGPVLQGLNKPVNDLSRGALVEDIVNTVAITAVQAQDS